MQKVLRNKIMVAWLIISDRKVYVWTEMKIGVMF